MMEQLDAIGFVLMNSFCRNCFQTGCIAIYPWTDKKKPTVGYGGPGI